MKTASPVPVFMRFALAACLALAIAAHSALAAPIHVYLTWQGDTSTTITVNFQTKRAGESIVHFDTASKPNPDSYAHTATGSAHQVPGLKDGRWIHTVELTGLEPGRDYYFAAGNTKGGFSKELKFRTVPADDRPLRFVTGGDMNYYAETRRLLELAGKQDPAFAVVGGDIAYCNGRLKEFKDWDHWLDNWERYMVTSDGHTIPMVLAIGNHEVNDIESPAPLIRSPFYMGYFAQEGTRSYFSRRFGQNLLLLALDSGHLTPHDGEQKAWLENQLESAKSIPYRFAVYHVPFYPSVRAYDGGSSVAGRTHWMPLFDKYDVQTAFENHDHAFKRTYRLKNGEKDPTGTLYLGDGCFGVEKRDIPEVRWYEEKVASEHHFWIVDLTTTSETYVAMNDHGKIIDHVERTR